MAYPFRRCPLQLPTLSNVRANSLRGGFCGALAAVVWGLQQPLDKAVFASRYDDVEVLGRAVRNGRGWYPIGLLLHAQNGALFGAMYANVAPALPIAPVLRGPAMALTELVATWPLAALSDRFHPARDQLPPLYRSGRAFAQAVWRHILFGFILGELERRMAGDAATASGPAPDYASNGHGSLDRAMSSVQ